MSSSDAFNHAVDSLLIDPTALVVTIKLDDKARELNQTEIHELLEKVDSSRTFLMCFDSREEKLSFIYWKVHDREQIFHLKIENSEEKILEFILGFLKTSFENEHDGEF